MIICLTNIFSRPPPDREIERGCLATLSVADVANCNADTVCELCHDVENQGRCNGAVSGHPDALHYSYDNDTAMYVGSCKCLLVNMCNIDHGHTFGYEGHDGA